jgi:hypothetical protein
MPDSRNDWGTQPFYLTVMLKFLLGIVLVQAATVTVVLLAPADLRGAGLLRVIVPVLVIGFLAAFWFASIAHHLRKDHLARVSEEFARERENLRVNAERSKARAMKQAQKHIAREAKATHAKANFKVGAAFSGIIAIGALLMLTQFLTVGIIALSTAAGALGGYFYRARQCKASLAPPASGPLIDINAQSGERKPSIDRKSL